MANSGGRDCCRMHAAGLVGRGAFFRREQEISAATVAEVNISRIGQRGDDSRGDAQMAATANAVANQRHAGTTPFDEAQEVREERRRHLRAQILEEGLALARRQRTTLERGLGGEKSFNNVLHGLAGRLRRGGHAHG